MTAPLIAALDDGNLRRRADAAVALAHHGGPEALPAITARLARAESGDLQALTVALEILDDRAAVAPLLAMIATAADRDVASLHTALARISRHHPVLPAQHAEGWPEAVRKAWAAWDPGAVPRPRVEAAEVHDGRRASFVVADGLGLIGIDYELPPAGSSWVRWGKALSIAHEPVYGVGSDCGTCQTTLYLIGWASRPAAVLAAEIRARVADVAALDAGLLDALGPLLTGLRSGHYVAALADADVEHVTDPAASWLARRYEDRDDDDDEFRPTPDVAWPGTAHFQCRDRIPGPQPTYGLLLPSRPLDGLDVRTVAGHRERIDAGRRPAALVTGWVEDRYVEGEFPERFLVTTVLDGHHKLAAYAAAGVPARMLLLCRVEDLWGPPENRTAYLDEILATLALR